MQLVLLSLEKRLSYLGTLIIIDAALLMYVGDFQVESPVIYIRYAHAEKPGHALLGRPKRFVSILGFSTGLTGFGRGGSRQSSGNP